MLSRCYLLFVLIGVILFCQCYAETTEGTTEAPKKEPTASEAGIVTGVIFVSAGVVLAVLLPTIAIDKLRARRERNAERS